MTIEESEKQDRIWDYMEQLDMKDEQNRLIVLAILVLCFPHLCDLFAQKK